MKENIIFSGVHKHYHLPDRRHVYTQTGYIDFYAFLLPLAQRIEDQPETYEDILAAFKVLDEEDNGYLTTDQLYEFLTTLGEELEDFEIELLLKMSETKGTGKIYYQEFVEKMMGIVKPKAKGKNGKK